MKIDALVPSAEVVCQKSSVAKVWKEEKRERGVEKYIHGTPIGGAFLLLNEGNSFSGRLTTAMCVGRPTVERRRRRTGVPGFGKIATGC